MKIWIMNHYAGGMYFDKGWRHYQFAKYLKNRGHEPVVFCANSGHGNGEVYFDPLALFHEKMAEEIRVPFVFVKARPYRDNGSTRIWNMADFYRNVMTGAKLYAAKRGRPDLILASSVHPLTLVAGIRLAAHFRVRCICEVRDLWPESIVACSGRWKQDSPLIKMLYQGEKWIYQHADALIFTMEGGMQYIRERKWDTGNGGKICRDRVYHINNGVSLAEFEADVQKYPWKDPDLLDQGSFKVVYTGSIRHVNQLGIILDSARLIQNRDIRFLIWGDGDEAQALKQRVKAEQIQNVVLKGRVDKEYIPYITRHADINLIHWAASPLLKYGVSFNKLPEYLAAGRPVFSTVRPGYSLLRRHECGCEAKAFRPDIIAEGIRHMYGLSAQQREKMSANARKAAERYDFDVLGDRLMEIMYRVMRG